MASHGNGGARVGVHDGGGVEAGDGAGRLHLTREADPEELVLGELGTHGLDRHPPAGRRAREIDQPHAAGAEPPQHLERADPSRVMLRKLLHHCPATSPCPRCCGPAPRSALRVPRLAPAVLPTGPCCPCSVPVGARRRVPRQGTALILPGTGAGCEPGAATTRPQSELVIIRHHPRYGQRGAPRVHRTIPNRTAALRPRAVTPRDGVGWRADGAAGVAGPGSWAGAMAGRCPGPWPGPWPGRARGRQRVGQEGEGPVGASRSAATTARWCAASPHAADSAHTLRSQSERSHSSVYPIAPCT